MTFLFVVVVHKNILYEIFYGQNYNNTHNIKDQMLLAQ